MKDNDIIAIYDYKYNSFSGFWTKQKGKFILKISFRCGEGVVLTTRTIGDNSTSETIHPTAKKAVAAGEAWLREKLAERKADWAADKYDEWEEEIVILLTEPKGTARATPE